MSSTRNKDRNIIKLNTETSHAETLACDAYRPGAKRGSESMERTAGLLRAGQVGPSRPPLCQEREGRAWSAAHPPLAVHTRLAWTEWEEPGSVTPTETEPFHSSSPCTTPQGVTDVPATRDSGQRARAPTQSSSRGPGVTGRSGKTGHSGRGSCRARGAWAGGGAARLDELRSSVRGPRKAARRFGTRTLEARRGAGRAGRAAGDAYLAQQCPRYRNP